MPTGNLQHGGFSQRLAAGFIDGMQLKVAIGGRFDMHTTPGMEEPGPDDTPVVRSPCGEDSDEEIEKITVVSQLLKICMGRAPCDQPTPEKLLSAVRAHPGSEQRQTESGFTALHFLCENPYVTFDAIKVLLRANSAAACVVSMYGECPLHILCRNPSETLFADGAPVLPSLIEAYPEAAGLADTYGNTPLHWIVRNPQATVDAIQHVLEACPQSAALPDSVRVLPPLPHTTYLSVPRVLHSRSAQFGNNLISRVQADFPVLADSFRACESACSRSPVPLRVMPLNAHCNLSDSDKFGVTQLTQKGRAKLRKEMDIPDVNDDAVSFMSHKHRPESNELSMTPLKSA